jgi:hypothetical protein
VRQQQQQSRALQSRIYRFTQVYYKPLRGRGSAARICTDQTAGNFNNNTALELPP